MTNHVKRNWLLIFLALAVIHSALTMAMSYSIGSKMGTLCANKIARSINDEEIEERTEDIIDYSKVWRPVAIAVKIPFGFITEPISNYIYQEEIASKVESGSFNARAIKTKLYILSAIHLITDSLLFALTWTLLAIGIARIKKMYA